MVEGVSNTLILVYKKNMTGAQKGSLKLLKTAHRGSLKNVGLTGAHTFSKQR